MVGSPSEASTAETAEPEEGEPSARRMPGWLRQVLPWLVTALIFVWLFSQVPITDALEALQRARVELFLPAMAAAVLLWFGIDAAAFSYLFTRFNAPLPFAEARSLRGMTYILTPINWNLGTAAVVVHLRTSKGIGALQSTSSLLFYQAIDALVLAGYALLGTLLLPLDAEIETLRNGAAVFIAIPITTLAVFMSRWPRFQWLLRIRAMEVFRSHQAAAVRDVVILVAIKLVYFAVFILLYWFGSRAFGIDLPIGFALASTPIIMLVGSLPVTPAGLGTQQAAMLYFYAPYGDEASILAFGLLFPIALVGMRLLLGLLYLRDLPKLREALALQQDESAGR